MARRKTQPEAVRTKYDLAERLRVIRTELYGERGGPELARQIGVPIRTWYNYESGVTVPSEVLLRFIELTAIEPGWLLHGREPRYRVLPNAEAIEAASSVESLLRTSLQRLEGQQSPLGASGGGHPGDKRAVDAASDENRPGSDDTPDAGPKDQDPARHSSLQLCWHNPSGSLPSAKGVVFVWMAMRWLPSSPMVRSWLSPIPIKDLATSKASWLWPGWIAARSCGGSKGRAATPCSALRTPLTSRR